MLKDTDGSGQHRLYYKIFLHIFIPLFFGTTIYAFWRGIHFIDPTQKVFPFFNSSIPPDWIKYNLPDGLWLYALLSAIIFIWRENFSGHFIAWLLIAIIITFFSEVLQAYNFILGTFDWKDLLAYSIATTFCFFNFQHVKKQLLFTFKIIKQ